MRRVRSQLSCGGRPLRRSSRGRKKILVAIFQRGAADGLNIVVPFGEKDYYALRPTIAIPEPSHAQRCRPQRHRP